MSEPDENKTRGWTTVKSWVVGLTGVLVVLPALINGALDVYKAALKVPRTESERINSELFQKYFNKPPVVFFPIPIKQAVGIIDVQFSVFEGGDVFVEYGNFTQWFPFPNTATERRGNLLFTSEALAQDGTGALRGTGPYKQQDKLDGGYLIRERSYPNGVFEKQKIDTRSGEILDRSSTKTTASTTEHKSVVPLIGPIDLTKSAGRSADLGKEKSKLSK